MGLWGRTLSFAVLIVLPVALSAGHDHALYHHGVVKHGGNHTAAVALTFDDGPDPTCTAEVLDILDRYGARATFFVVTSEARKYPDLVARILADGHEIAHHTHTHPDMRAITPREIKTEFELARDAFGEIGVTPRWYRPPRKSLCYTQKWLAREHGMGIALWTRSLERSRFESASEVVETVVAETGPGDILLAHDGRLDRAMTVEALPGVLEGLAGKGLDVVTLSELEDVATVNVGVSWEQ